LENRFDFPRYVIGGDKIRREKSGSFGSAWTSVPERLTKGSESGQKLITARYLSRSILIAGIAALGDVSPSVRFPSSEPILPDRRQIAMLNRRIVLSLSAFVRRLCSLFLSACCLAGSGLWLFAKNRRPAIAEPDRASCSRLQACADQYSGRKFTGLSRPLSESGCSFAHCVARESFPKPPMKREIEK